MAPELERALAFYLKYKIHSMEFASNIIEHEKKLVYSDLITYMNKDMVEHDN